MLAALSSAAFAGSALAQSVTPQLKDIVWPAGLTAPADPLEHITVFDPWGDQTLSALALFGDRLFFVFAPDAHGAVFEVALEDPVGVPLSVTPHAVERVPDSPRDKFLITTDGLPQLVTYLDGSTQGRFVAIDAPGLSLTWAQATQLQRYDEAGGDQWFAALASSGTSVAIAERSGASFGAEDVINVGQPIMDFTLVDWDTATAAPEVFVLTSTNYYVYEADGDLVTSAGHPFLQPFATTIQLAGGIDAVAVCGFLVSDWFVIVLHDGFTSAGAALDPVEVGETVVVVSGITAADLDGDGVSGDLLASLDSAGAAFLVDSPELAQQADVYGVELDSAQDAGRQPCLHNLDEDEVFDLVTWDPAASEFQLAYNAVDVLSGTPTVLDWILDEPGNHPEHDDVDELTITVNPVVVGNNVEVTYRLWFEASEGAGLNPVPVDEGTVVLSGAPYDVTLSNIPPSAPGHYFVGLKLWSASGDSTGIRIEGIKITDQEYQGSDPEGWISSITSYLQSLWPDGIVGPKIGVRGRSSTLVGGVVGEVLPPPPIDYPTDG